MKKQRTNWLIERFEDQLLERNFEHLPERSQFRKTHLNGFQNMIYNVTDYDDLSIVDVFVGLRNDAIEQLAIPFLQGANRHINDLNTIVTSIRHFLPESPNRFKVYSPKDAQVVVNQSIDFLQQHGFAVLEKLQNLNNLNALLNDLTQKELKWCANPYNRAVRALIAARLAFHPDFELLAQYYLDDLDRRYTIPKHLNRFKELVVFLESYSVN
ncbi:MAG: hypothetical protein AAGG68_11475 [Bacteroidota bacterium]